MCSHKLVFEERRMRFSSSDIGVPRNSRVETFRRQPSPFPRRSEIFCDTVRQL